MPEKFISEIKESEFNEKEYNERLGKRLSAFLNALNMSQVELAQKVGVTPASVNNWCKGIKIPRMPKIDKICEVLGITRSQLMDDTPEGNKDLEEAIELYQRVQSLSPEKQAEFQSFLEFLQSKS